MMFRRLADQHLWFTNDGEINPIELIDIHGWLSRNDPQQDHHERHDGVVRWRAGEPIAHDINFPEQHLTFVLFKDTPEGRNLATYFKLKWA